MLRSRRLVTALSVFGQTRWRGGFIISTGLAVVAASVQTALADKKSIEDDLRWKPPATAKTLKKQIAAPQESTEKPADPELAESAILTKAKGVGDTAANIESTILREGLKTIYDTHIRPLEEACCFGDYYSEPLNASDFNAKPSVLVLGQYSVGKTTSLRYLLGQDFASMRIGPEPTTDNFTVICAGRDDTVVPGNAAVVQSHLPYKGLSSFGTAFLNKFKVVSSSSLLPYMDV